MGNFHSLFEARLVSFYKIAYKLKTCCLTQNLCKNYITNITFNIFKCILIIYLFCYILVVSF